MRFIEKYLPVAKVLYLLCLGVSIPIYIVLYGATGHRFNFSSEDVAMMTLILTSLGIALLFFMSKAKNKTGWLWLKILYGISLITCGYEGIRLLKTMADLNLGGRLTPPKVIFLLLPFAFIVSAIILFLDLIRKKA